MVKSSALQLKLISQVNSPQLTHHPHVGGNLVRETNNPNDICSTHVCVAEKNLNELLTHVFKYVAPQKAVVVFDAGCELACTLTRAYRTCLPEAQFIDFSEHSPDDVLAVFAGLAASDLVVLVQSTNFRLEAFRIRVELFKRGLKVIEHPHLSRMVGDEVAYYLDALAYDPEYFRGVGSRLKAIIDQAQCGCLDSGGDQFPDASLIFGSPCARTGLL